mgnify:CR=1 FL=1
MRGPGDSRTRDAAAAARALRRGRARAVAREQRLRPRPRVVDGQLLEAEINDDAHAGHRHGRLGDVRRDDDARLRAAVVGRRQRGALRLAPLGKRAAAVFALDGPEPSQFDLDCSYAPAEGAAELLLGRNRTFPEGWAAMTADQRVDAFLALLPSLGIHFLGYDAAKGDVENRENVSHELTAGAAAFAAVGMRPFLNYALKRVIKCSYTKNTWRPFDVPAIELRRILGEMAAAGKAATLTYKDGDRTIQVGYDADGNQVKCSGCTPDDVASQGPLPFWAEKFLVYIPYPVLADGNAEMPCAGP